MNIAITLQHKLVTLLRNALFGQTVPQGQRPAEARYRAVASQVRQPMAGGQRLYGNVPSQAKQATARPALKVLHVVDQGMPSSVGRMVISGRMADVCAELDRLAAREAMA